MEVLERNLEKLLLSSGKVTEASLDELKEQAKSDKVSLKQLVFTKNLATEEGLTKQFADEIGVTYVDLNIKEIPREVLVLIPEHIAKQYKALVYEVSKEDGTAHVVLEDPEDIQAIDVLQKVLGNKLVVNTTTHSKIIAGIDSYRGSVSSELAKVVGDDDEADEEVSDADIAEDSPIAQTVSLIIEYAIRTGASDIHIEPREDYVSVRYRVDGILKEVNRLPKKIMAALTSRIKILSNLKIDERRAPQDGRLKIVVNEKAWGLRVSTLPIMEGEKVVMRVLNDTSKALSLEDLGYWGTSLKNINNAMIQPHGMILVTGPTGSGKSTSLFSALSILNNPKVNISTVEDPVEYRIPGVNQTQVNPKAGMTFVNGLRALLRQDPNIIMVGEIRDGETASLGVQAALTGHLVFSTLHTNNAATCLPRLLDMNIEPFLIASTVRCIIGQRLVRRLCMECREQYEPTVSELEGIVNIFGLTDAKAMARIHALEETAEKEGIGTIKGVKAELGTTERKIIKLWRAKGGGCDACNHNGYKGRMGIYEVLDNSTDIQGLIVSNATSDILQSQAVKEGMITMQMDGFIKALRGLTGIEEILRVTRE
jgi:type IV pilus assembly protein PilB